MLIKCGNWSIYNFISHISFKPSMIPPRRKAGIGITPYLIKSTKSTNHLTISSINNHQSHPEEEGVSGVSDDQRGEDRRQTMLISTPLLKSPHYPPSLFHPHKRSKSIPNHTSQQPHQQKPILLSILSSYHIISNLFALPLKADWIANSPNPTKTSELMPTDIRSGVDKVAVNSLYHLTGDVMSLGQ